MPRKFRRKYFQGRCDDCARFRRVTHITFWVNGMHYTVCAECIKPYRKRILTDVGWIEDKK